MSHFSNNRLRTTVLCFLVVLSGLAFSASPSFNLNSMSPPRLSASFPPGDLAPGSVLSVQVTLDSGWHINADTTPDEFLLPSKIEATNEGLTFGKAQWPKPLKIYSKALELETWVFGGTFSILLPVTKVQASTDPQATTVTLHYQACSGSICLAPAQVSLDLKKNSGDLSQSIGNSNEDPKSQIAATPTASLPTPSAPVATHTLPVLLFFAFVGGLILNLMPCVLPVLSIKALSLAKHARESRRKLLTMGLSMAFGIFVSFWSLAAIVITVQKAGGSAGWGFQFQNPGFLVAMIILITLFALNLFGVFEIWLPSVAQTGLTQKASRKGFLGAFMNGVLMTLLSTPCSAPFLGSAMGYAFTQPPLVLVLFFTACGLGLAFPYLMLSLFPQTLKWIPKPGNWMIHFKQFLGFLMLVTSSWLLWVLGRSAGIETMGIVLVLMIALGFGAWVLGLLAAPGNPFWKVVLGWMLIAAIGFAGWAWYVSPQLEQAAKPTETCGDSVLQKNAEGWYRWSPEAVTELQHQGKTIFVDFTADWCLTCKTNETAVLTTEGIKAAFAMNNVALMKADFTRPNAAISQALHSFGRSGVPLYVIYPGNAPSQPIALSEILTPDQVQEALKKAGPSLN